MWPPPLLHKTVQKATVPADMIYLGGGICRLCKWPAPGPLCAVIHYHHKAVDVPASFAFSVLSMTGTGLAITSLWHVQLGRWPKGEECRQDGV